MWVTYRPFHVLHFITEPSLHITNYEAHYYATFKSRTSLKRPMSLVSNEFSYTLKKCISFNVREQISLPHETDEQKILIINFWCSQTHLNAIIK